MNKEEYVKHIKTRMGWSFSPSGLDHRLTLVEEILVKVIEGEKRKK